jgi:hypothetical protein
MQHFSSFWLVKGRSSVGLARDWHNFPLRWPERGLTHAIIKRRSQEIKRCVIKRFALRVFRTHLGSRDGSRIVHSSSASSLVIHSSLAYSRAREQAVSRPRADHVTWSQFKRLDNNGAQRATNEARSFKRIEFGGRRILFLLAKSRESIVSPCSIMWFDTCIE